MYREKYLHIAKDGEWNERKRKPEKHDYKGYL